MFSQVNTQIYKGTDSIHSPAVGDDALVTTVLVLPLRVGDGGVGTSVTDTL